MSQVTGLSKPGDDLEGVQLQMIMDNLVINGQTYSEHCGYKVKDSQLAAACYDIANQLIEAMENPGSTIAIRNGNHLEPILPIIEPVKKPSRFMMFMNRFGAYKDEVQQYETYLVAVNESDVKIKAIESQKRQFHMTLTPKDDPDVLPETTSREVLSSNYDALYQEPRTTAYMRANGLAESDMIFINGTSMTEIMATKHGDLNRYRDTDTYNKTLRLEVLMALNHPENIVHAAKIHPTKDGEILLEELNGDMDNLEFAYQAEQKSRSAAARLFGRKEPSPRQKLSDKNADQETLNAVRGTVKGAILRKVNINEMNRVYLRRVHDINAVNTALANQQGLDNPVITAPSALNKLAEYKQKGEELKASVQTDTTLKLKDQIGSLTAELLPEQKFQRIQDKTRKMLAALTTMTNVDDIVYPWISSLAEDYVDDIPMSDRARLNQLFSRTVKISNEAYLKESDKEVPDQEKLAQLTADCKEKYGIFLHAYQESLDTSQYAAVTKEQTAEKLKQKEELIQKLPTAGLDVLATKLQSELELRDLYELHGQTLPEKRFAASSDYRMPEGAEAIRNRILELDRKTLDYQIYDESTKKISGAFLNIRGCNDNTHPDVSRQNLRDTLEEAEKLGITVSKGEEKKVIDQILAELHQIADAEDQMAPIDESKVDGDLSAICKVYEREVKQQPKYFDFQDEKYLTTISVMLSEREMLVEALREIDKPERLRALAATEKVPVPEAYQEITEVNKEKNAAENNAAAMKTDAAAKIAEAREILGMNSDEPSFLDDDAVVEPEEKAAESEEKEAESEEKAAESEEKAAESEEKEAESEEKEAEHEEEYEGKREESHEEQTELKKNPSDAVKRPTNIAQLTEEMKAEKEALKPDKKPHITAEPKKEPEKKASSMEQKK